MTDSEEVRYRSLLHIHKSRGDRTRMSHRRSETDIVTEILRATLNEPGITKVMYSTNLNHVTAEDYLGQLQKKGLIEIIAQFPRKRYRTTLLGKQLLGHLEEVSQLLQQ